MKKYISMLLSAVLAAGMLVPYAYAEETDCYFNNETGTTVMHGGVALGKQDYPLDVTVSIYDSEGDLNFQYVITTDLNGDAEFSYINDGKSGDYTCYFAVRKTGYEKSVKYIGFKGNDYYDDICASVNNYAKNGNFADAIKLLNDNYEALGFTPEILERLESISDVERLMKNEYKSEYPSTQEAVLALKRAAATAYINQEHSADSAKSVYDSDKTEKYFMLSDALPKGKEKPVIEELSEETAKKIFTDIAKSTYTVSQIAPAFTEKTLLSGIKNCGNYKEVQTLIEAYKNAGKLDVDVNKGAQTLADICKSMVGQNYTSYKQVENAYTNLLKNQNTSQRGGSSGGGGGGFSIKTQPTVSVPTGITPSDTEVTAEKTDSELILPPMYFDDIEDSKWALDAINYLYERNVINGCGDRLFMPTKNVSRAEFAKMLVGFMDYAVSENVAPFTDVSQNDWYAPYVATAYEKKLFGGYGDGSFGVSFGITRQEAASVIYRMICEDSVIKKVNTPKALFADDAMISDWAKTAIYTLFENKVISGRSENIFSPAEQLTRAEASMLIYNARTYFGK